MEDGFAPSIGLADLRLGDCLSALDDVPDGTVKLAISSPPYNIGKPYERDKLSTEAYVDLHTRIAKKVYAKLSEDGSLCWQVGNHVRDGELLPLDYTFYPIFHDLGLRLRNRVIWHFNFGLNADRRFSGRYETVLWFTKSDNQVFNLDAVRVPQLYPGKRHSQSKGAKAGLPSGNPKGKNPGDCWKFDAAKHFSDEAVWDIPNVKANHPEKTDHICQFPIELVERFVLALTDRGDTVLDPFVGVGTSVLAAIKHGRTGIGIEKEKAFLDIAEARVDALRVGTLPMRALGTPVRRPKATERVAQIPEEWITYPKVEAGGDSLHGGGRQATLEDQEGAEEICG